MTTTPSTRAIARYRGEQTRCQEALAAYWTMRAALRASLEDQLGATKILERLGGKLTLHVAWLGQRIAEEEAEAKGSEEARVRAKAVSWLEPDRELLERAEREGKGSEECGQH